MGHDTKRVIDDSEVDRIAELASADARSVWKRLAGGKLKPKVQSRIDAAIAAVLGSRESESSSQSSPPPSPCAA
jgi:hypothetical protein